MTKDQLLEKANSLPLAPGVYLMHDKDGAVIYVGKAKKLKNRVSQYFQAGRGHNLKTQTMVSLVDTFDTIIVGSEFEALVLENALIKQYMPRYNILLKDDKGYPFVRLSREAYRRFSLVSRVADDGARYFGPYGGRLETRSALDAIRAALHLPTCHKIFPRDIGRERPCLNHHMGRCDGFCRAEMSREEYDRRMDLAVQLLEGKVRLVTAQLEQEMEAAAEALRFEEAAALRDRIQAIKVLGLRRHGRMGSVPGGQELLRRAPLRGGPAHREGGRALRRLRPGRRGRNSLRPAPPVLRLPLRPAQGDLPPRRY